MRWGRPPAKNGVIVMLNRKTSVILLVTGSLWPDAEEEVY